jgi:trehalose 6-phosphate synthase
MADCVVASNRGPIVRRRDLDGTMTEGPSPGGLATMLRTSAGGLGATWVAAAEGDRSAPAAAPDQRRRLELATGGVVLRSLAIEHADYHDYYDRVSNGMLWFLHHHLPFDPSHESRWPAYLRVNERFAEACAEEADPGGEVLIQDYQLSLAPLLLRRRRPDLTIAHSTSCPWAEPRYYRQLPPAIGTALIDGLLGADLVGFMVERWADSFLGCCADQGFRVDRRTGSVRGPDGRRVRVRVVPVGVDADDLRAQMRGARWEGELDHVGRLAAGRRLVARIDRAEPSKNIVLGVRAYERLLERQPNIRGRVVHYVMAHSPRAGVAECRAYVEEIERAAREVNARFGGGGWQPIHLDTTESRLRALAVMAQADVLVVNPVRDGMNLVCKEGVIASLRDLVLILSSEAGAADTMADGALIVGPGDVEELVASLARALEMSRAERERRAACMRARAVEMPPRAWLAELRHLLAETRTHLPG